jgi:hypothetical protein
MAQPPNFFSIFRLLGSIGSQQRVGFWRNVKKSQNHCTVVYTVQSDPRPNQGEGPPVCYDVKYMDCTVHGSGASKFPLLQQENLTIELLRAV